MPSFLLFLFPPFFGVDYLDLPPLPLCSPSHIQESSLPLSYSLPVSVSPSLSPLLPYFKRTNVSCSHCSTTLVFCSQFSREPGGSSCFELPQSNPTQGRQRESRKRLEELKELRKKRGSERETALHGCPAGASSAVLRAF